MTERPQLSIVGRGQGGSEAGVAPTGGEVAKSAVLPRPNDHLAAALRAQREANAELILEIGVCKVAAELAAKRQDGLAAQLQQESATRLQVEAELRELKSRARLLTEQLAQATAAGHAMHEENVRLAASAEAAADTIADLRQQVSEVTVLLREAAVQVDRLKAVNLEQSLQIAAAQVAIGDERVQRDILASELVGIQAEASAAEASLRAAMGSNSALTSQMQSERAAAMATVEALETQKAALTDEIDLLKASYAEMAGKAEARYDRVNELTAQLAELDEDLSRKDAAISSLGASLDERNSQYQQLVAGNASLVQRVAEMQATVRERDAAVADANQRLATVRAEASQREEQLRASLALSASESQAMTRRVESVEAEGARLVASEQALRAELADLNLLLDERRHMIRQLQQELALLKLGKKRSTPVS